MQVQTAQEALFIACEMERGAVQLYQRALLLMKELGRGEETLMAHLQQMLRDEQRHLQQFSSLYEKLEEPMEQQLLLSAVAENVLFRGGLMGAVREGILRSAEGMLRFAAQSEENAVQTYRAFAEQCGQEHAGAVLLAIAAEEERHLADLRLQESVL